MKAIIPNLNEKSKKPLYIQIYEYIKDSILSGETVYMEKLPSLRNLSDSLHVSITTVDLAYSQLEVEGYIFCKPQSGYYVNNVSTFNTDAAENHKESLSHQEQLHLPIDETPLKYDLNCFDFNKWKKCINKVFTDTPHKLLFESDPQGELVLREEISRYVYTSRGVKCHPSQIVIAAGTQQITSLLSTVLHKMNISNVAVEEPGYLPVNKIFRDRGFTITSVEVLSDGINIGKLPANIPTAVYVNPSNQFPTGAVMPVGKRYQLLEWASSNNSYIIEDDYDSELRYFGRPVPSLQGLDNKGRVIYLGSFSSTLFASAKISYMILPESMARIFQFISSDYAQTCSKTEQLALAYFMSDGKYQTGIKKLRRLYSQKLQLALSTFEKYGSDFVKAENTSSGINMILNVKTDKEPSLLAELAEKLGIQVVPSYIYTKDKDQHTMIFYYNKLPLDTLEEDIKNMLEDWKK
ncbi:MAG: PLP-dependent aminotransferase family protein [Eubacterium sp.]|nr:PLP-dependent aminotransferase family protein [Eubacterium sp.]